MMKLIAAVAVCLVTTFSGGPWMNASQHITFVPLAEAATTRLGDLTPFEPSRSKLPRSSTRATFLAPRPGSRISRPNGMKPRRD